MTHRTYVRFLVLGLVLWTIVGLFIAANLPAVTDAGRADLSICQEDEPCWDCETMGNRLCGAGHHN